MNATTSGISTTWRIASTGLFKPPFFIQQLIFGILGGIGPGSAQSAVHEGNCRPVIRQRLPSGRCWLLAAQQMPLATQAAMMGGNVRVGLED
jgi:uncharacterized protein (DUF849 family)